MSNNAGIFSSFNKEVHVVPRVRKPKGRVDVNVPTETLHRLAQPGSQPHAGALLNLEGPFSRISIEMTSPVGTRSQLSLAQPAPSRVPPETTITLAAAPQQF
jgi:hypothetical protein